MSFVSHVAVNEIPTVSYVFLFLVMFFKFVPCLLVQWSQWCIRPSYPCAWFLGIRLPCILRWLLRKVL